MNCLIGDVQDSKVQLPVLNIWVWSFDNIFVSLKFSLVDNHFVKKEKKLPSPVSSLSKMFNSLCTKESKIECKKL